MNLPFLLYCQGTNYTLNLSFSCISSQTLNHYLTSEITKILYIHSLFPVPTHNPMASSEPLIKIIPPNPVTHSILIVYCYTNNKTIQCQAKWSRLESLEQNQQNQNNRSPLSMQTGNTYKCTPLDFNHVIQVQGVCEFQGKQFKLVTRTEPVKATKQILQRKLKYQLIHGKINYTNHQIQCIFGLESSLILQIKSGPKVFNLDIHVSNIVTFSITSFKARIQSNKHELVSFFHQCSNHRQKVHHQLSLGNIFQFIFKSQTDKDLILLKIAQMSSMIRRKNDDQFPKKLQATTSHQHFPLNLTKNQPNGIVKNQLRSNQINQFVQERVIKTKRNNFDGPYQQNHKKESLYGFKTPDPKSTNTLFNYNPFPTQLDVKQQMSANKKTQKIKISEKNIKEKPSSCHQNIPSQTQNQITSQQRIKSLKEPSIASNDQIKTKKTAKEFLNIFDDEEEQSVISQPNIPFQNSSPQFYGLVPPKSRLITTQNQNQPAKSEGREDLPSINLRGSFEELQKFVEVPQNKKQKEKIKTETSRQLSYQYPKARQKTELPKTPPNQMVEPFSENYLRKDLEQMKRENEELKKENAQMRKQLEAMNLMSKQNSVLKKKYYQLSEQVGRLELEMKQILGDKLKWESSFHREKGENETLRKELQQLSCILQSYTSRQPPSLQVKQRREVVSHLPGETADESRHKTGSQTPKFVDYPKRNHLLQSRDKTPPTKLTSHNQSLIEDSKPNELNSQSRKQLRFPNFSYKYNSTSHHAVRP